MFSFNNQNKHISKATPRTQSSSKIITDKIILGEKILQNYTKNNFYYTYYDSDYILYEPTRFICDVFSVSFNFWFSKQEKIYPYFYFVKNNILYRTELNTYNTEINNCINISFGPFQKLLQEERPTHVYIVIKTDKKIIFYKNHKIPNFNNYSWYSENLKSSITLNFMVASCFFFPGYRTGYYSSDDQKTDNINVFELYKKFRDTSKEKNAEYIFFAGDIVYLEYLNITSELAIQTAYSQLRQTNELKGIFSNHSWFICNDDHELSFNDGSKNGALINVLRNTLKKNFPTISEVSDKYIADSTNIRNILLIKLDAVSERTINPELCKEISSDNSNINYNKYLSILGEDQLQFLLNSLTNVFEVNKTTGLCFIILGKSMFGERGESTFVFCPLEREKIFNHIKLLGLRNVCFICGDSHFSDISEIVLDSTTNQIVREIRCSGIGSTPRPNINDNINRVEGSLVDENNFGNINIVGTDNNYTVTYDTYTINGIKHSYSWNTNYI